jgi:hypothetical protein
MHKFKLIVITRVCVWYAYCIVSPADFAHIKETTWGTSCIYIYIYTYTYIYIHVQVKTYLSGALYKNHMEKPRTLFVKLLSLSLLAARYLFVSESCLSASKALVCVWVLPCCQQCTCLYGSVRAIQSRAVSAYSRDHVGWNGMPASRDTMKLRLHTHYTPNIVERSGMPASHDTMKLIIFLRLHTHLTLLSAVACQLHVTPFTFPASWRATCALHIPSLRNGGGTRRGYLTLMGRGSLHVFCVATCVFVCMRANVSWARGMYFV